MKRAVVVLLLLIANILFGSSKVTPPDSAPGKLLGAWLAAYNAADIPALRDFAEKHYTPEARGGLSPDNIAQFQKESRQSSGGFDLLRVENASAFELTAFLKGRNAFPRTVRLSLKVSEQDPTHLLERKALPTPPAADELAEVKSTDELARLVEAKFGELAQKDEFSGAALIAKDGVPVWQK